MHACSLRGTLHSICRYHSGELSYSSLVLLEFVLADAQESRLALGCLHQRLVKGQSIKVVIAIQTHFKVLRLVGRSDSGVQL